MPRTGARPADADAMPLVGGPPLPHTHSPEGGPGHPLRGDRMGVGVLCETRELGNWACGGRHGQLQANTGAGWGWAQGSGSHEGLPWHEFRAPGL